MNNQDLHVFYTLLDLEQEGWVLHLDFELIRVTLPAEIREKFGLNDQPVASRFRTAREASAFADGFKHALLCQQMAPKGDE